MPASVEIDRPELGAPHHFHGSPEHKKSDPAGGLHPNHMGHAGKHSRHLSAQDGSFPSNTPHLARVNTAPPLISSPEEMTGPEHPAYRTSWSGTTATSLDRLKPLHIHGLHLRHRSSLPSPPLTHGPRGPPQPLLPARNPAPFNVIDDIVPFLDPFRKFWRWIKRKTESQQSKQRRLRKHKK
jgi:putative membrane protein